MHATPAISRRHSCTLLPGHDAALLTLPALACVLWLAAPADAGGDGARVRRGNATFTQVGNRLVVRASNGAIIDYDRLSVEAGQVLQFIQPGARARVLNRVTGAELSRIDGTLLANGIVYFVNPQGIRIGNGAVINVGGLIAAAGAMSSEDFVLKRDRFTEMSGEVVNQGQIQGRSVLLAGQYVENRGSIDAGDGVVAIAAGDTVYLQRGTGPVVVAVSRSQLGADGSGAGSKPGVSNTGRIDAGRGSVAMASGDFYSQAMDLSGTIIGKSISARGGERGVVAVRGAVDASSTSGRGGSVDLFGDRVGLFAGASVKADGASGGGGVRIGGDLRGANATTAPQAERTSIGAGTVVSANATRSGEGGRVIVWSSDYTAFLGAIEAKGAGRGRGGFVETSSRDNLQAFGSVDTGSALGRGGTWLLDPTNVTVGAVDANMTTSSPFEPTAAGAQIRGSSIAAALRTGDVVLQTTHGFDAGAEGNITFASNGDIVIASGGLGGSDRTLTVNATGSIIFATGFLLNNNDGARALNVGLNAGAGGAAAQPSALVDLRTGTTVTTGGGDLSVTNSKGNASTIRSTLSLGGGDFHLSMNAAGASLAMSGGSLAAHDATFFVAGGAVGLWTSTLAGDLAVTAGGAVTDGGTLSVAGQTTLAAGPAGNITLDNANNFGGAVTVTSGRDVTLRDTGALTIGGASVSGNLALTAAGVVTDTGTLSVTGTTRLTAGSTNDVALDNANNFGGAVTVVSARDVTLRDTGALVLAASTVSGNLAIWAGGAVTDTGNLSVTGTASLAAGAANDITLDNANNFGGTVTVVSGRDVTLRDTGAIDLGASTVNRNLSITAGNTVSDSGVLSVAGSTVVAAGTTHDIILDSASTFGGPFTVTSGRDVTLRDTGAIDLGASTISRNLVLNAGGPVTQAGNLLVTGTTTVLAPGSNITLASAGNNFSGAISVTGANVALADINAIAFGATTITGDYSVASGGAMTDTGALSIGGAMTLAAGAANSITLDNPNNFIGAVAVVSGKNVTLNDVNALKLGQSTISGNLVLTAAGLVTDAGAVAVSGTTRLTAGAAHDIFLDNANNFGGAVTVVSGRDVVLRDTGALTLGTSTVNRNLAIAAAGTVADSGNLSVAGTTTLAAGAGGNITLDNANNFVGAVTVASGRDVTLRDTGALTIGGASVSGNLALTAAGVVTDTGSLAVAGTTRLTAGAANDITLNNANDFGGAVTVVSGRNVTLNDVGALGLGASTIGGNLVATAAGGLTGSGALSVAGTTLLTAGSASDIVLDGANNFGGTVTVTNGRDVTLRDTGALDLGASSIGRNLSITAGGALTDSGNLAIAGTTTIAAGATNDITLDNADSFGGAVTVVSGRDVTLRGTGALELGASTVSGDLSVTARGPITGGGILSIAGTTLLSAGAANDIVLDAANNFGGTVTVASGRDVVLRDAGAIDLGASAIDGSLAVRAGGAITGSGALRVDRSADFAAAGFDVILNSPSNDFRGAVTTTGGNVTLTDANTLILGATTASGVFTADCGAGYGDTITFLSSVGAVSAPAVRLNTGTSIENATIATIVSRGDIVFLTDDFRMGQNHKLTALGDIAIRGRSAPNAAAATLGDVTARGDLTVQADSITLLGRNEGLILLKNGGTAIDRMVDFVVGGRVFFSVAPIMGGAQPANRAAFANPTGNVDGSGTLGGFIATVYPFPITAASLIGPGPSNRVLDLYAAGELYTNPSTHIPPQMAILPPVGAIGEARPAASSEEATAGGTDEAEAKESAASGAAAPAPEPVPPSR